MKRNITIEFFKGHVKTRSSGQKATWGISHLFLLNKGFALNQEKRFFLTLDPILHHMNQKNHQQ